MGKVVLDDALRARLNGLDEHLEVCDPDGRVVGHYLPADEYLRLMYDWAKAEFDRQDAEDAANGVVRKWDGANGKTTTEAIAWLKSLRQAGGR